MRPNFNPMIPTVLKCHTGKQHDRLAIYPSVTPAHISKGSNHGLCKQIFPSSMERWEITCPHRDLPSLPFRIDTDIHYMDLWGSVVRVIPFMAHCIERAAPAPWTESLATLMDGYMFFKELNNNRHSLTWLWREKKHTVHPKLAFKNTSLNLTWGVKDYPMCNWETNTPSPLIWSCPLAMDLQPPHHLLHSC